MKSSEAIARIAAGILAAAFFGFAATMVAMNFAQAGETIVNESQIHARYDGQNLAVTIPFNNRAGAMLGGKLSCTILDMQDSIIGEAHKNIVLKRKNDSATLTMRAELKTEDLAAARIKYSFRYERGEASGIVGMQSVADWLELRVLGQDKLLPGSPASLRVIVLNHRDMAPVLNADIKVSLSSGEKGVLLYSGKSDNSGTMDATFNLPPTESEEAKLIIDVSSPIGKDSIEKSVKIARVSQTYLVTDKPIYQPGQRIHMRTITLGEPSMLPLQDQEIVLEVMDAKGNKVFKKIAKTDRFGVCFADFDLADEINMGPYKIAATVGNDKTEKTVNVERYVLPKFNVQLKTDKEYYKPGETLKGTLSTNYFFGKPVAGGKVKIELSKFDVGFAVVKELTGKTDNNGSLEFELELPDYFVGQPLEQGNAFVKMDIEVQDLAEHTEKKTETRTVAASSIRITLIPESGEVVPKIKNRIYCMTTYPDGKPAVAQVTLNGTAAKTDSLGVATFEVLPTDEKGFNAAVTAKDEQGNTADFSQNFTYNMAVPHILLRTDRPIYKVGNIMQVSVWGTNKTGTVYVDLIKDGQTMLTKSLRLKDGTASQNISLTADLSGAVKVHAYIVGATSDITRDTRTVYIDPANDLNIDIIPDRDVYRPGEDGTINFTVTDKSGKPVVSCIGIAIVDQAVFALTEMQPGMEKVYFTLEREIMTPRYEIHGFTPEFIVLPIQFDARRQEAATILFASFQEPPSYSINVNTYEKVQLSVQEKVQARVLSDLEKFRRASGQYRNQKGRYPAKDEGLKPLVRAGLLKDFDILDPWGTPYEVEAGGPDLSWFDVRSWGPDKKRNTPDDLTPSYNREWGEGGVFDELRVGRNEMMPMMMKEAIPIPKDVAESKAVATGVAGAAPAPEEPRIRRYFPETMLFKPDLITDGNGKASLKLKWADSITEWRLTSTASSTKGALGSKTSGITVFQDFFVDIDLPVSLTQGDEVSVPLAVYNYLKQAQDVKLTLSKEDWFTLMSDETVTRTLAKDEVTVVYFRIKVTGLGKHSFTVKAYGSKMSDAISREIEVLPDGELILASISDRLEGKVEKTISIPAEAIDGPSKILVKVFPGIFSQIVNGLESMLGMPFGCFEQTSSVTYPNILILDYMRKTEQATPETEMKAEGYISIGYQRLLSYEVTGGGFEWFGNAPANKILTAYGLMEFHDMSNVYEVDEGVIGRTTDWLLSKQEADGSWKPDAAYLHQESWGRIQKSEMLPTAYITWALLEVGEKSDKVKKGIVYIKENLANVKDPYMLALCANALAAWDKNDEATRKVFDMLREKAIEDKGAVYWKSEIPTFTYSQGDGADLETTALVAYALVKYGRMSDLTNKALTYLVRSKEPNGTWGGTQATTMALRALLASLGGNTEDVNATVTVSVNGKQAETLRLTKDNADVMRLVDLKEQTVEGKNTVTIELTGKGSSLYEIVSKYYIPWQQRPTPLKEFLSINVDYDKTELSLNDLVTCKVEVKNNAPGTVHMVIVDLGIPPGFEVQSGDLAELVGAKIQKFNLTGRQVIVYLDKVDSGKSLEFSYRLRAKFPLKAKTVQSKVYEYYNPEVEATAPPVEIVVK